jgi:hypothetical protein
LNIHEYYEELCALAASGQASPVEIGDLRAHLETCPMCRSVASDFYQISARGLSMLAAKQLRSNVPSGMTARFVARARSEGIEIGRESVAEPAKKNRTSQVVAVAAAVVLTAGLLVVRNSLSSPWVRNGVSAAVGQAAVTPSGVVSPAAPIRDSSSDQQLATAQKEIASMDALVRAQRKQLESLKNVKDSLSARVTDAEQQNARFKSEGAQREARITQLQSELEKSRADKNASGVAVAVQEAELRDLRKKAADQEQLLRQQEEFARSGDDVRQLVVARNLHIIDVHDRNGNGQSQRAFGRIFYTEGKSLIFYAYDLADPRKVDAKVSFYVWGGRLGADKPVRSLGIFHNDDAKDGRWVLTFDDPHVLTQIDSVFVTVESARKPVNVPEGRRILFASLGDKPNHP